MSLQPWFYLSFSLRSQVGLISCTTTFKHTRPDNIHAFPRTEYSYGVGYTPHKQTHQIKWGSLPTTIGYVSFIYSYHFTNGALRRRKITLGALSSLPAMPTWNSLAVARAYPLTSWQASTRFAWLLRTTVVWRLSSLVTGRRPSISRHLAIISKRTLLCITTTRLLQHLPLKPLSSTLIFIAVLILRNTSILSELEHYSFSSSSNIFYPSL